MKAHKYWSIGAVITMAGTFYTGYKGSCIDCVKDACVFLEEQLTLSLIHI